MPWSGVGRTNSDNYGIGTTVPTRKKLHVNDVMRLQPRSSAPSSPQAGDMYIDSSDGNRLKVYDGSTWPELVGNINWRGNSKFHVPNFYGTPKYVRIRDIFGQKFGNMNKVYFHPTDRTLCPSPRWDSRQLLILLLFVQKFDW
jgi:hypothetical protein